MVGLFINTLPMRVRVSADALLLPWLNDLQDKQMQLRRYEYAPLVEIKKWSDLSRDLPLFESMLVFESQALSAPMWETVRRGTLQIRDVVFVEKPEFPLTVVAMPDRELSLLINHSSRRFDSSAIGRMLGHFKTLLAGVAANPGVRIGELPMLAGPERHQALVEWNDAGAEYPLDKCVHQVFEAQAHQRPDAIAVVSDDNQLTYKELNGRANQVARCLRKRGVGPESIVAMLDDRTQWTIVGILGILKAGGAYFPIDIENPTDRILSMLSDSKAELLLLHASSMNDVPTTRFGRQLDLGAGGRAWAMRSQSEGGAAVPERSVPSVETGNGEVRRDAGTCREVVLLDRVLTELGGERDTDPENVNHPDDVAYVMYTSGSTGAPKGISVPHRAVNRLVFNTNYVFLDSSDCIAQASNASFDAATFEIWGALLHGARLVEVPKHLALSPEELAAKIQEQGLSTMFLTTALFNQLVMESPSVFGPLRDLLFGGEAVDPKWVREVMEKGAPGRLLHVYGPTENTTFTSWHLVRDVASDAVTIPIGRPISNTSMYILDGCLEPVPIGVWGELYIGGAGLSRGYVNDGVLTGERYVPNPYSGISGDRMYRSGDICRYLRDGSIEIKGRVDDQVKLRGYRIELGEIESVLVGHELVRECVVLCREDGAGGKRLVAYVVKGSGGEIRGVELRSYLSERLPEYMVPSSYVMMESLPLTSSGKVDRRSLPEPGESVGEDVERYEAPRTEVEEKLAGIWSEVLGVKRVGIHDNFFELGGDSILAIQIVARANERGVRFTPKQLFERQTIAELSSVVGRVSVAECEQGIVEGEVPLTPVQRWFFERDLGEVERFNQAFMLELGEGIEADLLEVAIERLVLHHDALRLRYEREGSEWRQFNAGAEAVVGLSRVDLRGKSELEQERSIESATSGLHEGLDLRDGPVMGAILFNLGGALGSRLLMVIHHLVVDVVSWRVLLEDLWTAYEQLSRGEPVRLPAKTTSFKRWSERLKEYGKSGAVRVELEYWLSGGRFEVVGLPVDRELVEGANTVGSSRKVRVSLRAEETRDLLQEVPKAYSTRIEEVLLAALLMSFARWTGSRSLLVDVEGHGREELFEGVDLSRTVGWFTSIYPMLLDLSEEEGVPGEGLKRIKEQVRGVPNHGIGYGVLRYLSGDAGICEKLRAMPKSEVSFNYLGRLDRVLDRSSFLELTEDIGGPACSPSACRAHLLEVIAFVGDGRLQLVWIYSENVHLKGTVKGLAEGFLRELRSLISHCLSPEARSYTPSDFPLAKLDEDKLRKVGALLDRADTAKLGGNGGQDEEC
jgi:amino acid adenylation domain-containing protein/non-ribosomal peptide synthase protein (TIGR01720 family)